MYKILAKSPTLMRENKFKESETTKRSPARAEGVLPSIANEERAQNSKEDCIVQ